ncbi:MAG: M16 family metallopeptidase [Pyrinomonadaceae bacterium]
MMNTKNYSVKFALFFLILLTGVSFAAAQIVKSSQPRQEKLLNGLKVLLWNEPTADKVTVKLRINSGAAFDTLDKEGTMALLGDILFPDESAKEFFREDLGGSLVVETNYDYIQINATGDADQVVTILETIAKAVTKPTIDKETTAKVRAARLEKIKELEKNPSYLADQIVAKRLFGDYPYGKSAEGTSASLQKIDFADLLLAKQRFLTADNATLAVSGSAKPDYVYKAVRQLFGGWEKADKKIPATFAEPAAPDTKFFLIKTEINNASELRFAFRGMARSDKDVYAAQIAARVLQNRLQKKDGDKVSLRQNSYFLPGLIVVKFSDWDKSSLKIAGADVSLPENFLDYVEDLLRPNITADEYETAKSEITKDSNNQNQIDSRLDADTFRLAAKTDAQTTSLADAQRVLERWRKEAVVRTLLIKTDA